MRAALFIPLPVLLALACSEPPPPPPPPPPPAPAVVDAGSDPIADARVMDVDQRCTKDSECTLTTEDCCGCNALGRQIGVRKDRLQLLAAQRRPVCTNVSCPQALSDDASCMAQRAVCREGKCMPNTVAPPASTGVGVESIDASEKKDAARGKRGRRK